MTAFRDPMHDVIRDALGLAPPDKYRMAYKIADRLIESGTVADPTEVEGWVRRWADMEGAARAERERAERAEAAVAAAHAELRDVPEWRQVHDLHIVTTGERIRCEVNDGDDNAMELTVSEQMSGWRIQGLFRGTGAHPRYFTAVARDAAGDTDPRADAWDEGRAAKALTPNPYRDRPLPAGIEDDRPGTPGDT